MWERKSFKSIDRLFFSSSTEQNIKVERRILQRFGSEKNSQFSSSLKHVIGLGMELIPHGDSMAILI